jgi:hypothetical protein
VRISNDYARAYPRAVPDREPGEDHPDDEAALDAQVRWRPLPDQIKHHRVLAGAANEHRAQILQPRIDGHLQVYGLALDGIDHVHRHIAENTDLDIRGSTRQAAVWLVAGRCIGYMRATLTLLAAGFGAESAALMRSVHEATRLLDALADQQEPELLRRWLADEWVRPKETRQARERMRDRLRAHMEAEKADAESAGDSGRAAEIAEGLALEGMQLGDHLKSASLEIYDILSRIGHTRRSGIGDAVAVDLREMATGPHPDAMVRAGYVEYAGHVVEEVVRSVGDMLSHFYGPGWFGNQVQPLIDSMARARDAAPLDSVR